MIIVIVGALENRTEALESCYARAFSAIGHEVFRWDPVLALARQSRAGRLGKVFSQFVHVEAWLRKSNLELLALVTRLKPQLLLVIGTNGVRAGTLGQVRVQSPQTKLFCLYPDSPHNLDADRILCLPMFDHILVSSPGWIEPFQRLGGKQVDYLPFAADTVIHKPVVSETKEPYQIAFVGTWRLERELFLEQFCDLDLAVWGSSYWRSRTKAGSPLKHKWVGKSLAYEDFPQACSNTKIMINLIDGHTWPGPNMRCFELAGCGAFQLVTRTPTVSEIFSEGTNIECFETIEEARSKIDHYLRNDEGRMRIAQAGRQLILDRNHTYTSRAESIIQLAGDLHTSQSVNN